MTKIPYIVAAGPSSTNITDVAGRAFTEQYVGCSLEEALSIGNFLAFIPAISTYAFLSEFRAPFNPAYHIFDLIDTRILKAASEKKCMLVFDTSSEGDRLVEDSYENLHAWLDKNNIPRKCVIIVNQNREYSRIYQHKYGDGIQFLVYDSYIKRILNMFRVQDNVFEQTVGFSRDRIRFRNLKDCRNIFVSLNGAPRPNRIVFVAGMMERGLLDLTAWSMLGDKSGKLAPSYADALTFRSKWNLDWIGDEYIESVIQAMPKFLPIEKDFMSAVSGSDALALKINPDLYDLAFCSIATETEFTDGSVRRISELSMKPIIMGHPLISVGNPGSLRLIRDIGFQTFAPAINEDYDDICDPAERLTAIYQSMEKLHKNLGPDSMVHPEEHLREACEFNARFAAGSAIDTYEVVIEKNLIDGLLLHQARVWGAA